MKLGIFGGTFDPIHHGHLLIAEKIRERTALDEVLFMPAGTPPHRQAARAGPEDRLEMVRLATADNPFFSVSDFEVRQKGRRSFSIETVHHLLRERTRETKIHLLLGMDAFAELETWHRAGDLVSMVTFLVAERPGAGRPARLPEGTDWQAVQTGLFDYSAREIRDKAARGLSIRYLVPEPVRKYIREKGIYATRPEKE